MSRYIDEYRELIRLGAPVLVTQLGVIVVSFVDTMMVGRYGTSELAAAAFVNSIYVVVMVMMMGLAGGVTPLVGALYTQKRNVETGRTLRAAIELNLFVAVVMTGVMGGFYFLIDNMGQPPELIPLIKRYYLILLPSIVTVAVFNVCQQTANGITDTQMPMWIIIGINLLNIGGNYVLIYGKLGFPEMGLAGAGIATLFSRITGATAIMLVIAVGRRYRPYITGVLRPGDKRPIYRKIWVTSYPPMVQSGIECALWTLGTVVCGWFGAVQLASYQVVNTIAQLGFMTYMSFSVATSIRVANLTGLRRADAVVHTTRCGLHLNLVLATLASLAFILFTHPLLAIMSTDEEVIRAGTLLIVPLVVYQYFDAIQLTYANAQRGTSVVKPLLWTALICYVAIGVPALLLLGAHTGMGNVGVYYSFDIVLLAASVSLALFFHRTMRRLRREWYDPRRPSGIGTETPGK